MLRVVFEVIQPDPELIERHGPPSGLTLRILGL